MLLGFLSNSRCNTLIRSGPRAARGSFFSCKLLLVLAAVEMTRQHRAARSDQRLPESKTVLFANNYISVQLMSAVVFLIYLFFHSLCADSENCSNDMDKKTKHGHLQSADGTHLRSD